jgi:hypothetical protein
MTAAVAQPGATWRADLPALAGRRLWRLSPLKLVA